MGMISVIGKSLGNIKKGDKSDTSKPFHTHSSEKEKPVYDKPPERGGRTVAQPDGLDKVGILPAMNPPMAVPTSPNIDEQGVNSLYSDKM